MVSFELFRTDKKVNLHLTGGHFFWVCMAGLVKFPIMPCGSDSCSRRPSPACLKYCSFSRVFEVGRDGKSASELGCVGVIGPRGRLKVTHFGLDVFLCVAVYRHFDLFHREKNTNYICVSWKQVR